VVAKYYKGCLKQSFCAEAHSCDKHNLKASDGLWVVGCDHFGTSCIMSVLSGSGAVHGWTQQGSTMLSV